MKSREYKDLEAKNRIRLKCFFPSSHRACLSPHSKYSRSSGMRPIIPLDSFRNHAIPSNSESISQIHTPDAFRQGLRTVDIVLSFHRAILEVV